MIWLDILLDRAPYPCICNAEYPKYGKTYSGKFFVECRKCIMQAIAPNRKDAIYNWDSRIMKELDSNE